MSLRRRVSPEVGQRWQTDQELAARYPELLSNAGRAERELRRAQQERRPHAEISRANAALRAAVAEALAAAEAGERAATGPAAYDDRIARRKALARAPVRRWTDEADRLRTAREAYRLELTGRIGTHVPSHVQVGTHAVSGPHIPGVDMAEVGSGGEELAQPRIGVDLDRYLRKERT